jgi:hypothetical protein
MIGLSYRLRSSFSWIMHASSAGRGAGPHAGRLAAPPLARIRTVPRRQPAPKARRRADGSFPYPLSSAAGRRQRRFISATCSGVMRDFPGGPVNHSTMRFHSASMISL